MDINNNTGLSMQTFYGLRIKKMYVVTDYKICQYENVRFISTLHFNYNNNETFAFLYDDDIVFTSQIEALQKIKERLKTALKDVNKQIKSL